jgi:TetR/AcrR family transcriptional regulator
LNNKETFTEDKKELILDCAKQIFAKYGYAKTTLEDIANVLGLKKNTLYYYFPGKEAIFKAVLSREANLFWNEILSTVNKKKSASQKLYTILVEGMQYTRKRVNLHDFASEAFLDVKQAFADSPNDFSERQVDEISKIVDEGIKNNEFKKCNSKEIARCLINFLCSVEHREIEKSKKEFLSEVNFELIDNTIIPLLNLIIEGMKVK